MNIRITTVITFLCAIQHVYLWDPDAGVVPSLTKLPGVTVNSSSSYSSAHNIIDNSDSTHWTSSHCLPTGYFSRSDVNVLFGACAKGRCSASAVPRNDIIGATDGTTYKVGHFSAVTNSNGQTGAFFSVNISSPMGLKILTIDGIYKNKTDVYAVETNGIRNIIATLNQTNSYKSVQIADINQSVERIEIHSDNDVAIREIAAIGSNGCVEKVTVDLGVSKIVGTIRTRHWAGSNSATAVDLKTSLDGVHWDIVKSLEPTALHAVTTDMAATTIRYIQLVYFVKLINYNKVYCWEIDAWDENGRWGSKITPKPQTNSLRSIFGVNGIWGWGHSKYSNLLNPGEGPWLYNEVASHARNYHNLDWDVTDPDNDPQYQRMANGIGTQAKHWLNWDQEYTVWKNASLIIDASIQFTNKTFSQSVWNNPEQAAYNYGHAFAQHFGPGGKDLIAAMEVGNEPWDYDASFYATVLKGMSAGARHGDPQIKILPGAFQADDKHSTGNYIGTRVQEEVASDIDAINFHTYSYFNSNQGVRTGTFPEHKESTFNSLRNIIRWRDTNMPNKPIWVTEWGWDASGCGEDCVVPECVDETAQAVYGLRGLLILARHNIEKATWYFYANSNCNTLYCRSGLTTSKQHHFAKKIVFLEFQTLLNFIGDKYFLGIVREDSNAYVYMFGDSVLPQNLNDTVSSLLLKASALIAWRPDVVPSNNLTVVDIELPQGKTVYSSHLFAGGYQGMIPVMHSGLFYLKDRVLTLHVTSRPLLIEIKDTVIGPIVG